MEINTTQYPSDYTFAAVVGKALGLYVSVADFSPVGDGRMFRMIVDGLVNREQLRDIMDLTVRDHEGVFSFSCLESVQGPVVDQGPRRNLATSYIRVTLTR
jgi:hypothetical protein